ncbi:hypothetical protein Tco_0590067 [Tanacetum coccineum]
MVNTRTDAELAAAVQAAVDAMLPQIRDQVREEYRTGAVASGSNPPPVTIHTWLERFNKQKPRSFEKAVAPVDAENWISHMEKIFDVMDCNDAFKTRLAVYKFEGDALAWWKAYKQAKGGDVWAFPRQPSFVDRAAGTTEEQAKNFRWGCGWPARNLEILRDRDDYDRNLVLDRDQRTEVTIPPIYQLWNSVEITSLFSISQGSCRHDLSLNQFPAVQDPLRLVIFKRTWQKNTGAVRLVHADKKPTHQAVLLHYSGSGRHDFRYLSLQFDDKIRSVNALPLDMCEFDIILDYDCSEVLTEKSGQVIQNILISRPSSVDDDGIYGRNWDDYDKSSEFCLQIPLASALNAHLSRCCMGKLSPSFQDRLRCLDRVGEVSYRLALPPQLSHVHNVFHVSLLRGYKYHPLHVVSYPFDQIREDLSYTEEPESIPRPQDNP